MGRPSSVTQSARHVRYAGHALCAALCSVPLVAALIGKAAAEPPALASADPARVTPKLLKHCKKCHYETGVSDDPEIPQLAGQRATYLCKQLQNFKADRRDGGPMNKTAEKLSDRQMSDLAAYFSAKTLPAAVRAPVSGAARSASPHGHQSRAPDRGHAPLPR